MSVVAFVAWLLLGWSLLAHAWLIVGILGRCHVRRSAAHRIGVPVGPEDDPVVMARIAEHAADLASDREAEEAGPPATFTCLVCGDQVFDWRAHSALYHGGRSW